MKLKRILTAAFAVVMTLGMFSLNTANAAGTYSISCKNDAYGMQLGSDYTDVAYVYASAMAGQATSIHNDYLIHGTVGAYVGNDCIYSGAGDTNGTQVVAGDVARLAVNAIVGAVSNRVDMAYAAKASSASATGLSFSTQDDGFAMSANGLIGGISLWGDFGNSNVENTQSFTNVRLDSMKYDGDASSYSVGVDKAFGKALVGVVVSNVDADFKTTFNDGTYKQSIDTYGMYLAYKTSVLQIDLGFGQGDSTIDTTRRDLGNDKTITGSTTADVEYSNARIAANFTRGKFTIVPSASYRAMSMDIAAFTDVRPSDDSATVVGGAATIFSTGNATLTTTDDAIAARTVDSETMSIGLNISANLGMMVPYLSLSYDSEDTTDALFKSEAGTDGSALDLKASNYETSYTIGGGVNFMIGSHVRGGLRLGMINGREDWDENYMSGNISIGF
ncbi:MAG: hypothetical protein CMJ11_05715 [Pelagibacterales bacterium]|nr:hypothetical protein [Pelagibacterales bacterium]MBJ86065.1 hypothetical protein [Pelagibacterales bacterium]|tara:strand:- start:4689 stop:6029 length:1341 start_codon:yes stop_codon:yes gene_type:complete